MTLKFGELLKTLTNLSQKKSPFGTFRRRWWRYCWLLGLYGNRSICISCKTVHCFPYGKRRVTTLFCASASEIRYRWCWKQILTFTMLGFFRLVTHGAPVSQRKFNPFDLLKAVLPVSVFRVFYADQLAPWVSDWVTVRGITANQRIRRQPVPLYLRIKNSI